MITRIIQTWFTWLMVLLAFIVAFWNTQGFVSAFFSGLLFFYVGITGLWAATGHLLQPEQTAKGIGWAASPFQREMGFTNLAIGIAGIFAPWQSLSYQFCLIIIVLILMWGCAYGHIKEIIEKKNYAVHNAGPMLYSSLLIPPLLWVLYWMIMGI